MSDTALRFQPTTVGNMVVDAKGGYVSYEELAAAIAQRDKAVADVDHFFVLSGQYLARANDAEAQRDKEIQKRKEISEATVKLFKYLRPYLTEECQKMVDEADAVVFKQTKSGYAIKLTEDKDLTKFEPDWVSYGQGCEDGYAEAQEQAAKVCERQEADHCAAEIRKMKVEK